MSDEGDGVDFMVCVEIIMEFVYDQIVEIVIVWNIVMLVKSVLQVGVCGYFIELKVLVENLLFGEIF